MNIGLRTIPQRIGIINSSERDKSEGFARAIDIFDFIRNNIYPQCPSLEKNDYLEVYDHNSNVIFVYFPKCCLLGERLTEIWLTNRITEEQESNIMSCLFATNKKDHIYYFDDIKWWKDNE